MRSGRGIVQANCSQVTRKGHDDLHRLRWLDNLDRILRSFLSRVVHGSGAMSHGPRRARGSKAQPSYHLLCSAQRMHSVQSDPPHDRPTDWVIDWHALSELSNIGAQIDDRSVVQADRPTEHDFSVRGVVCLLYISISLLPS